jgi:hypothetical protein
MERLLGQASDFENPALGGVGFMSPDGRLDNLLKLIGRAISVKKTKY